jgi:hypothetical protein
LDSYIIGVAFFLFFKFNHELELEQRLAQRPNVQVLQNVAYKVFGGRLFVLFAQVVRLRIANDVQEILGATAERRLEQLIGLEQIVALVKAALFYPVVFAYLLQHIRRKLIQISVCYN